MSLKGNNISVSVNNKEVVSVTDIQNLLMDLPDWAQISIIAEFDDFEIK